MQDTLSRRAHAALDMALQAKDLAALKRFELNGDRSRLEFKGDVPTPLPPMDCGMPVMTGDPAIDPQFSKQPPSPLQPHGKSFWSVKVIPIRPCLR